MSTFKQCPQCENILAKTVDQCPHCDYIFEKIEIRGSTGKIVLRNIIGAAVGIGIYLVADVLLRLFFGWLITIPFVVTYLSWPVPVDWWTMLIICTTAPAFSLNICSMICLPNQSDRKWGVLFAGFVIAIIGAVYLIAYAAIGWRFIVQGILTILTALIVAISASRE